MFGSSATEHALLGREAKKWFYLVLLACLSVHRGLLRGSRVFTNPIMNLCQLVRACLVVSMLFWLLADEHEGTAHSPL